MLVLSRKVGEEILIGDNVRIIFRECSGGISRVAIDAPRNVNIVRGEVAARQGRTQANLKLPTGHAMAATSPGCMDDID